MLYFTISDNKGEIIRKLSAAAKKGVNRIEWDLRYAPKNPVSLGSSGFYNPFAGQRKGHQVAPGKYEVTMQLWKDGKMVKLDEIRSFYVKQLDNKILPAESPVELVEFKKEVTALSRILQGTQRFLSDVQDELKYIRKAITNTEIDEGLYLKKVMDIENMIRSIRLRLYGDQITSRLDIGVPPSIGSRVGSILYESKYSSSKPTQTHKNAFEMANEDFDLVLKEVNQMIKEKLVPLRAAMQKAGAPYTPNALPEIIKW
jgi:hypothetical protein